jgi:hypothetical protein
MRWHQCVGLGGADGRRAPLGRSAANRVAPVAASVRPGARFGSDPAPATLLPRAGPDTWGLTVFDHGLRVVRSAVSGSPSWSRAGSWAAAPEPLLPREHRNLPSDRSPVLLRDVAVEEFVEVRQTVRGPAASTHDAARRGATVVDGPVTTRLSPDDARHPSSSPGGPLGSSPDTGSTPGGSPDPPHRQHVRCCWSVAPLPAIGSSLQPRPSHAPQRPVSRSRGRNLRSISTARNAARRITVNVTKVTVTATRQAIPMTMATATEP